SVPLAGPGGGGGGRSARPGSVGGGAAGGRGERSRERGRVRPGEREGGDRHEAGGEPEPPADPPAGADRRNPGAGRGVRRLLRRRRRLQPRPVPALPRDGAAGAARRRPGRLRGAGYSSSLSSFLKSSRPRSDFRSSSFLNSPLVSALLKK